MLSSHFQEKEKRTDAWVHQKIHYVFSLLDFLHAFVVDFDHVALVSRVQDERVVAKSEGLVLVVRDIESSAFFLTLVPDNQVISQVHFFVNSIIVKFLVRDFRLTRSFIVGVIKNV